MLTTTLSEIRKHRPCESGWTEAPTCLTKPTAARRVIAWGRLKDRPEVGARYGQILEGARVMKSQRVNTGGESDRTHVDLFSGLGGFALAAHANGVRTVQFCEIDGRCRDFLARAWPGVPIHDDVRTFCVDDAQADAVQDSVAERERRRDLPPCGCPVWLLTAGVPCQPASRAGKQRGSADDRWLWPEALRVLRLLHPTWALFENPPGIGDVGLAGILAEVEAAGYEVRVHSIPACAVGSPHRRERYWIVAHHQGGGHKERVLGAGEAGGEDAGNSGAAASPCADGLGHPDARGQRIGGRSGEELPDATAPVVGHAAGERGASRERGEWEGRTHQPASGSTAVSAGSWDDFIWLPCADGKVRRAPDDTFSLVDGLHRSVLGALGNSIVPQVAEVLIRAMIQAEEEA